MPKLQRAFYVSTAERDFLLQLLANWEEGIEEAITATIEDPTVDTAEQLTILTGDMDEQRRTIDSIRHKLSSL